MTQFICRDSLPWLASNRDVGSIVTSLPDADEMQITVNEWVTWFLRACALCLEAATPTSVAIFYQTDRKFNGSLISTAELLFNAAQSVGARCLWHKIALRSAPGTVNLYRPGYTHMLCFSKQAKSGLATCDVFERGEMLHSNAMGFNAARVAVDFASQTSDELVDPFCGSGTVLSVAAENGRFKKLTGIDIAASQIESAKRYAGAQLELLKNS